MKITHVITSLNSGGAETMLFKLLKYKADSTSNVEVVTLLSGGFYSEQIKNLGITIHELNINQKKNSFRSLFQVMKIFKNTDVIQSWMYHSDIIAFIFGKLFLRKKVIWGVRRSYLDKKLMKKKTYSTAKICAYLSNYVDGIISCTIVGKKNHERFGYKNRNFTVIPNGFDLTEFSNQKESIIESDEQIRLLNVARWEPLKDHRNLLAAAAILKKTGLKFELRLVGSGMDENNVKLNNWIEEFNLQREVKLLGVRKDIPKLMRDSDIYISSSISEGFPNVIGEAMASNLYCVATDAGDTKYIIGGYGTIVPIRKPELLANGVLSVVNMYDDDLIDIKNNARKRIEDVFSIQNIVMQYETMYKKIRNN